MNTLSRQALILGGHGRGLDNKMSRVSKHNHDRRIDKRRRRLQRQTLKDLEEIQGYSTMDSVQVS